MPRYVLLITLTPEGRENILEDPNVILRAEDNMDSPDAGILGLYAVLGDIDFVAIIDAPDNESAARFSLELGARAGLHTTTLPAIPIGRLERRGEPRSWEQDVLTIINSDGGGSDGG